MLSVSGHSQLTLSCMIYCIIRQIYLSSVCNYVFLYGKVTGIEIHDIVRTAELFLEWCASRLLCLKI